MFRANSDGCGGTASRPRNVGHVHLAMYERNLTVDQTHQIGKDLCRAGPSLYAGNQLTLLCHRRKEWPTNDLLYVVS